MGECLLGMLLDQVSNILVTEWVLAIVVEVKIIEVILDHVHLAVAFLSFFALNVYVHVHLHFHSLLAAVHSSVHPLWGLHLSEHSLVHHLLLGWHESRI